MENTQDTKSESRQEHRPIGSMAYSSAWMTDVKIIGVAAEGETWSYKVTRPKHNDGTWSNEVVIFDSESAYYLSEAERHTKKAAALYQKAGQIISGNESPQQTEGGDECGF